MPAYKVSLTWNGEVKDYTYNLSHDGSMTQEEIISHIITDFYSNLMLEVSEIDTPCCPVCNSHTFSGCPACEDYL
jgi:hypothetical protein